jgi:hypothetical protein
MCVRSETSGEYCKDELLKFCNVSSQPNSYRSVFQSRMCLQANKNQLSKKCGDFLENESPSIVEPCFEEINGHCNNTENDKEFDAAKCINKLPKNKIRTECRVAMMDFVNSPELAWSSAIYIPPSAVLRNLHHPVRLTNLRGSDSKGEK